MTRVAHPAPRLVLVGATDARGTALVELIEERNPTGYGELRLVDPTGRRRAVGSRRTPALPLEEAVFEGADVVFLCSGSGISRRWARPAARRGALVVDTSDAFRGDPEVSPVVPEVNGTTAARLPSGSVVASPRPMTVALARLLHGVERACGVRQAVVSTYQAASGAGHPGMEELLEGSELALRDPDAEPPSESFRPPLAFNAVPAVGGPLPDRSTTEEERLTRETRRVLNRPRLNLTVTCVSVPVVSGHSATLFVEAEVPMRRRELVRLLGSLPGVVVHDAADPRQTPTPLTAGDPDTVHVGRVRVVPHDPRGFWLWLTLDDLRAGSARNALGIAEAYLARRGTPVPGTGTHADGAGPRRAGGRGSLPVRSRG
ncbi:aspartate-semialdehyde dehydrogenase [Streptomyces calidiresistens]|uniref:Aspartate-semialdehyde dehydrogenase n=1 Tax=Streptomyces calidiresistens TaxID=1485586 RepID=A0A7W3T5X8_9ACTN|nr:aspartate-semialdehyde dehydrogenase [Streptomyces calidiresistens]MBB0231552.1 aspartate-semialdehyde dehydrogenase [Streptomyces calidiresistens]